MGPTRRVWICAACALAVAFGGAVQARAATGDRFLITTKLTAPLSGPGEEVGAGNFGIDTAISADGSTALVGAFNENGSVGAAYVFARTGSTWALQQKLTAPTTGADKEVGDGVFGSTLALSTDGSTALIGGFQDNARTGAAWVYTRSGTTWSEQTKLTAPASGANKETGAGQFGAGIALSGDGNSALVGGNGNNGFTGAVWSYTRTGTVWSLHQRFLAPTSGADAETGTAGFGDPLVMTPDGSTAVIAGSSDNSSAGAAWIYSNSAGTWTEHQKLVGPASGPDAEIGAALFGDALGISDDGHTVLAAGQDDNNRGATWIYAGTAGAYAVQAKLTAPTTGPDAPANSTFFGMSAVLSGDGNTAVVADPFADNREGGAWQYTRAGTSWSERQRLPTPAGANTEIGQAGYGTELALSSDGTLLVAGPYDSSNLGAVWALSSTPPPVVSSVSPAAGPTAGGTAVSIHGSGFAATGNDAVTAVTFAGVPATAYTIVSATEIVAAAPPHGAGVADVIVTAPAGVSAIGAPDEYMYVAAPAAPTHVAATAGNGRATVRFTGSTGATSYTVTASPGGAHATATQSPVTITGLKNGTRYTFTVVAANAGGVSGPSAVSNAVTPFAPPRASHGSFRGVTGRHTRLALTVSAGPHSPSVKALAISLPRGLSFRAHHLAHVSGATESLRRGQLTVRWKRARGSVHIVLRRGIAVSRSLRRKHRGARLFTVRVTDAAGNTATLKVRLRLH